MVIGMYGSSPKVKCREGMCDVFQGQLSYRFQAEIVCRFRPVHASRDRVSISPGDRLGYVGDRLRFEKSSPR